MKKFIICITVLFLLLFGLDYAYYHMGVYIPSSNEEINTFVTTDNDKILLRNKPFEMKGVNIGSSIPGKWGSDYAIDYDTYLRWFHYIQEMGANTIRVYAVQSSDFYDALYEFNMTHETPLYLIQGVWVNDYIQNSYRDAYDEEFYQTFLDDCMNMVNVVHGKKKINLNENANTGTGDYKKDVSPWVLGYILGVDWNPLTVAYTDETYKDMKEYTNYDGTYLYTENARPFETLLARIGDEVIGYESNRYHTQRLISFFNAYESDPFIYSKEASTLYQKCGYIDVEHIKMKDTFLSGQFASYSVFPTPFDQKYFSDTEDIDTFFEVNHIDKTNIKSSYDSYQFYLEVLNEHHQMPVVVSEFGIPSSRGSATINNITGETLGRIDEVAQGNALVEAYRAIIDSNCAGGFIYSFQDEWDKRTWNTMHNQDLKRNPFSHDIQSEKECFGLLAFEPGEKENKVYVDGKIKEWKKEDVVFQDKNKMLSMKYDEKYLYFMIWKKDFNFDIDKLYLPIDTTYKTGSDYSRNHQLTFNRKADFIITIDGYDNTRIQVQDRYDSLRSTYSKNVYGFDTYVKKNIPDKNSDNFVNILMMVQSQAVLVQNNSEMLAQTFETGKLTFGNSNPNHKKFNSLSDFYVNGEYIEMRIPWQLLNFADASTMEIHDDYYEHYGVDYITIDKMYAGLGSDSHIELKPFKLEGWKNKVSYHERIKKSYDILKKEWNA